MHNMGKLSHNVCLPRCPFVLVAALYPAAGHDCEVQNRRLSGTRPGGKLLACKHPLRRAEENPMTPCLGLDEERP